TPFSRPTRAHVGAWREGALVAAGLAAITVARWGATRAGFDALAVGAGFGLGLLVLTASGLGPSALARSVTRFDPGRLSRTIIIGALAGLLLVGIAVVGAALGGSPRIPGLGRPGVAFLPWALVTVLVASAEEAVLRG